VQFHVFVLATFASLIAPFGGFFASGLKRTFKIKDFGDSIPGHGGMTDRMDCQFIMGSIAFFYYSSFIAVYHTSVGGVIEAAITGLSAEEQMEVVKILARNLVNQDVISPKVGALTARVGIWLTRRRSWSTSPRSCTGDDRKLWGGDQSLGVVDAKDATGVAFRLIFSRFCVHMMKHHDNWPCRRRYPWRLSACVSSVRRTVIHVAGKMHII
jgi:hypothetical protein